MVTSNEIIKNILQDLKENLKACDFTDIAKVTGGKLPGALAGIVRKDGPFDLVFVDPPYEKNLAKKTLAALVRSEGITPGGLVVVEHSPRDEMPDEVSELIMVTGKTYGSTALSIYERKTLEDAQENNDG